MKRLLIVIMCLAVAVVILVAAGAVAWQARQRQMQVYTDGRTISQPVDVASVREVLWQPPMVLPATVNAADQERSPTLSADGCTMVFARHKPGSGADLFIAHRATPGDQHWQPAQPLSEINSFFDDSGPELAADGSMLLFHSNRPGGIGGFDLWVSRRTQRGWTAPVNLGPSVNTDSDEIDPAISSDGQRLYFASNRAQPQLVGEAPGTEAEPSNRSEQQARHFDLYLASIIDGEPGNAAALDALNTEVDERSPALSPADDFLYFASDRAGGFGEFDLYRARIHGAITHRPVNLGHELNSFRDELDPSLCLAGFGLHFVSDRASDDTVAVAAGQHDMYYSESREVYRDRRDRGPLIDWASFTNALAPLLWWLLAALAAMLLLLLMLRGVRSRQLSLIARCLLASLAAHLILMILLTMWQVTTTLAEAFDRGGTKVVLTTTASNDDLAAQLRSGVTDVTVQTQQMHAMRSESDYTPAQEQVRIEVNPASAAAPPLEQVATALDAQPAQATDVPRERFIDYASHDAVNAPMQHVALAQPREQHVMTGEETQVAPSPPPHTGAVARSNQPIAEAPVTALAHRAIAPDALQVQLSQPGSESPTRAMDAAVSESTPTSGSDAAASILPHVELAQIAPQASAFQPLQEMQGPAAVEEAALQHPMVATGGSNVAREMSAPAAVSADAPDIEVIAPPATLRSHEQAVALNAQMIADAAPVSASAQQMAPSTVAQEPTIIEGSALDMDFAPPEPSSGAALVDALTVEPDAAFPHASATPALQRAAHGSVVQNASPANVAFDPAALQASAEHSAPAPTQANAHPSDAAPATVLAHAPEAAEIAVAASAALIEHVALPDEFSNSANTPEHGSVADAVATIDFAAIGSAQRSQPAAAALQDATRVAEAPNLLPGNVDAAAIGTANAELPVSVDDAAAVALSAPAVDDLSSHIELPQVAASSDIALPDSPSNATIADGPSRETGEAAVAVALEVTAQEIARASRAGSLADPLLDARLHLPDAIEPVPATAAAEVIDAQADDVAVVEGAPLLSALAFSESGRPEVRAADLAGLTPDLAMPAEIAPPANPFLQRSEQHRREIVEKMGGSDATEQAVALALQWFAAHQSADGRWATKSFDAHCGECRGGGRYDTDVATTALAMLCFLGADHTHTKDGKYRAAIDRALTWLLQQQLPDGDLRGGETMYSHGIATIALAEAYGMTRDPKLLDPVRRAAEYIVNAQHKNGSGWRYEPGQAGDTSVLGWQIMALISAKRAGVELPDRPFETSRAFLDTVCLPARPGLYGYQPGHRHSPSMTAEAMFVQQLLGLGPGEPRMQESAEYILQHMPRWRGDASTYYWYYATLAMFQHQGESWERWNRALTEQLLANQRTSGPAAGSWDPVDNWSKIGGRIYQTALCTLSLEVYYRYLPMYAAMAEQPTQPNQQQGP